MGKDSITTSGGFMSTSQAANLLGYTVQHVRELVATGKIKALELPQGKGTRLALYCSSVLAYRRYRSRENNKGKNLKAYLKEIREKNKK